MTLGASSEGLGMGAACLGKALDAVLERLALGAARLGAVRLGAARLDAASRRLATGVITLVGPLGAVPRRLSMGAGSWGMPVDVVSKGLDAVSRRLPMGAGSWDMP